MPTPPATFTPELVSIWNEVLERLPSDKKVDNHRLEVYCQQIHAFRLAADDVSRNGIRIEDATGRTVRNPSVSTLSEMTKQLNAWGGEFAPPSSMPKRRSGTMYDATKKAVAAAEHLRDHPEYAGAIEAVKTLAWLIDEAQRSGLHALQSAAYGTIPSYLKGCAALQITPAEAPHADTAKADGKRAGKRAGRGSQMRVVKVGA